MYRSTRIDLHMHSTHSDGHDSPETLAALCQSCGVTFVALTDHDTLEGLDAFENTCKVQGLGCISGVELTVLYGKRELHLLSYGFDRHDPHMWRLVRDLAEFQRPDPASYSMIKKRTCAEVISVVHQAGGLVFMAHPLVTIPDKTTLENCVADLVRMGLDGLEVYHEHDGPEISTYLHGLCEQHKLLASGGSDYHGKTDRPDLQPGADMAFPEWKRLRDRLLQVRKIIEKPEDVAASLRGKGKIRIRRSNVFLGMVVPALAAVVLFAIAQFFYFLPSYEDALLGRKRELIRELTTTVWSMMQELDAEVKAGILDQRQAQLEAMTRVSAMRYGREGKDYFWIQDTQPRMVMHPYRADLDGQDLSGFKDRRGVRIFVEFAQKAQLAGDAYVDYVWQWKDDPSRIEAKESYVRLFKPWGWVIGTGIYTHDVALEIMQMSSNVVYFMIALTAMLILLLLYMLLSTLRMERKRFKAEQSSQEASERYRMLVHAASEGILFVQHGRCAYANPVLLEMIGCDLAELSLLELPDVFPSLPSKTGQGYEDCILSRRNGENMACTVAIKGTENDKHGSFVVAVRLDEHRTVSDSGARGALLSRLLRLPTDALEDIARSITAAGSDDGVIELCSHVPLMVKKILDHGSSPLLVTEMIASVSDAATIRFIELAIAELGPAPCDFSFIALGSQARKEQTLHTDQDNALIIADTGVALSDSDRQWFLQLGQRVCHNLALAGYEECKGQVMASNPRWCIGLQQWKECFSGWVERSEEQEVLEFAMFFDIRHVFGNEALAQKLKGFVFGCASGAPMFLVQLARGALQFKSPLRLFGNIIGGNQTREHAGMIDLKTILMPFITFARLYSLQRQVFATATLDRLLQLTDQGLFLPSQFHDISSAFEAIVRLRLEYQAQNFTAGQGLDNLIDPEALGHIDRAILQECFREIDRMQAGLVRDFFGGASA